MFNVFGNSSLLKNRNVDSSKQTLIDTCFEIEVKKEEMSLSAFHKHGGTAFTAQHCPTTQANLRCSGVCTQR